MTKKTRIRRYRCEFILATDLFTGQKDLWDQFFESEPEFSWGSNNRTLVTLDAILNHMANVGIDCPEAFTKRCEAIGLQTYVDLEN